MGFGGTPREEEEDRVQIGVQEKGSSIRKKKKKKKKKKEKRSRLV
jgi:hypothetical protein